MRDDRRRERHLSTREEIITAALAVMTESGAGGLSLGEVARRVGLRTPSLYGYFDAKLALVDEIFRRGWEDLTQEMGPLIALGMASPPDQAIRGVDEILERGCRMTLSWAQANQAYAQVMFWRPIPGFVPSDGAMRAAGATVEVLSAFLATLIERGALAGDLEDLTDTWTTLVTGVVSQQLSNQPEAPPGTGRFADLIPSLVATYLARFRAPGIPGTGPTKES